MEHELNKSKYSGNSNLIHKTIFIYFLFFTLKLNIYVMHKTVHIQVFIFSVKHLKK